jgi:hypothetical protein
MQVITNTMTLRVTKTPAAGPVGYSGARSRMRCNVTAPFRPGGD